MSKDIFPRETLLESFLLTISGLKVKKHFKIENVWYITF